MKHSKRGAARVSVVWVIAAGVLALVALAFGFVANSDLGSERAARTDAMAQRDEASQRFEQVAQEVRTITEAVGWYDRESANPRTNVDAVQQTLSDLRDAIPDIDENVKDLERAVPLAIAAYNQRGQEVQELRNQLKVVEGERDAAKEGSRQMATAKDREIAQLRTEKADEAQAASSRLDELERRVAQLTGQNSEIDLELRRERQRAQELERSHGQELSRYRARLDSMGQTLAFTRPDNADSPDGRVVAVSDQLGVAFIDIGTRNRLSRGTRFEIRSGNRGESRTKAWGEVIEVSPDSAQIRISQQVDPFDPVVSGDVIVNPLYDPVGGRNAVLVGRFDGAFNEKELRLLLADIGINVQSRLDETTHYLIVGSEMWTDEDGEPLEEPIQPSELPVYKEARALGVQIVPLQNVREFFSVRRSEP